jgi:multicomponent Na+:H+ antiporter subunit D
MLAPAFALVAVGFGLSFAPGLAGRATEAAARFEARSDYAAEVLRAKRPPPLPHAPGFHPSTDAWLYGAGSVVGALAAAGFGLYRRRLPGVVREWAARVAIPPLSGLKALHSGVVGDYVAWLTLGTAALGGLFALTLR